MAGRDLPSLAFAIARFLQRENRRFPRTHRHRAASRRRRQGLGARSGPRRRFFAWNNRQNRRRGYARQGNRPLRGRAPTVHQAGPSAPATAANHAGPSAPARAVADDYIVPTTPPPSVFTIPPMDWLLGGPSAPFLGEEEMFPCELAPPPLPPYCVRHGFESCPARTGAPPRKPSPTPSDELPEHFMPPGYGPVPDLPSPTPAAAGTGGYPSIPDLNIKIKVEEEEIEDQGSSSTPPPSSPATPPPPQAPPLPPTPPPEARRILRQFAAAMAQNRAALRGAWSPDALGLTGAPGASSSGAGRAAKRGPPRFH
ncbi:unnamed protein product [Triticum turgidum subsp. durum]|uniref:Uncharacterized protein n=1 Tax=Triticum turgidum subsp. durum TaxID=4567 RepID=A0A9R1NVH0_TRITD|nr:unnamed protein product [Triticum turgidum subsp. durum]